MARITLSELTELLASHPEYRQRWFSGVPAEQALYISLGKPSGAPQVESETFDAIDGSHVVIDIDTDGRVCGIEIN